MLSAQVYDVIDATRERARRGTRPGSADAVRARAAAGRASATRCVRLARSSSLPAAQPLPAPAGGRDDGARAAGGARAVRCATPPIPRRCRPTSPRAATRARRGRLHRRHDRPLRAARARAADRPAARSTELRALVIRTPWRACPVSSFPASRTWCCNAGATPARCSSTTPIGWATSTRWTACRHARQRRRAARLRADGQPRAPAGDALSDGRGSRQGDAAAGPALRPRLQRASRSQRQPVGRSLSRGADRPGAVFPGLPTPSRDEPRAPRAGRGAGRLSLVERRRITRAGAAIRW